VDVEIYSTLMGNYLLDVKGLTRSFGEFQAVRPVDFEISAGEIIILTGPNGSGKTTLLHCLSGLLRPTKGTILIDGYDLYQEEVAAKQRMAFIPDVPRYYPDLTSWEHLYFISLAFGARPGWEMRAETELREFGLWDSRELYPHNLSRGMRLKLGICLALIRPFKLLLMDEPTSALDPESVGLFLEKLLHLRDSGKTILFTSHDLNLVEKLGGKSWRMDQGQLRIE
jgi:ABC-2 type transport system ATP-binding protein